MNPIIRAIYRHEKEILKELIAKGADVNFRERDGGTPLMSAVREKDIEIIRLLERIN
jgi:ankyrin repeat protein